MFSRVTNQLSHLIISLDARWNGGIVGQGGPTDAQLANVWSQLATEYKSDSKVIFGIMNEPHNSKVNIGRHNFVTNTD
jgi:aryl-phospho-beta-D-glucosidase BglC (GH1 family)